MKKVLEIDELNAKRLYKKSSKEFKIMLEDYFGKSVFFANITDQIKTFEDALAIYGEVTEEERYLLQYKGKNKKILAIVAHVKLMIIAEALNEGWIPNWEDGNERKWRPWFNLKAGFVFDYSFDGLWHSYSGSGSRLCFETEAKSNYAAQQFIDLWKDYIKL